MYIQEGAATAYGQQIQLSDQTGYGQQIQLSDQSDHVQLQPSDQSDQSGLAQIQPFELYERKQSWSCSQAPNLSAALFGGHDDDDDDNNTPQNVSYTLLTAAYKPNMKSNV
jgi:hypothetical protein